MPVEPRSRRQSRSTVSNVEPSEELATKRGKGMRKRYAHQACGQCRQRHAPCDEARPVCSGCLKTGRQAECSYDRVTVRKPRTEAHFQAMRNRIEALKSYASLLEAMVEKCRNEHGSHSAALADYQRFRPQPDPFLAEEGQESPTIDEIMFDADETDLSEDDDVALELCRPTHTLKLEDRDLVFYGVAAPFRYAQDSDLPPRSIRFPVIDQNPKSRYVLLVDGIDESHCNPDFDWSRHLPPEVPLDRKEHDSILDKLFKFFTSWCMRIVPALFLRDMYRANSGHPSHTPVNTTHYSPMLHNALLALATAFSDDPRIRDSRSRMYYVDATKRWLDTECRKPNICVVHALNILASYYSSNGEQMLGYMYFGMSARISQALGLGVNSSEWVKAGRISQDDMLDRNWAHWTTFSQDVCWSLYVGRDFAVPIPSYQDIPIPFVDTDHDQIPWSHPPTVPAQPNFLSKTFKASCELLVIARGVMEVVNGVQVVNGSRREIHDEVISRVDLQLHTWRRMLSPDVEITNANKSTATPHKLMMHLAYWWTFILLHRPFFHRKRKSAPNEGEIDHVKTCKHAADQAMDLLAVWDKLYTLRYVPITLIQVVFAAGTIYLLSAIQASSSSRFRIAKETLKKSVEQAELCIEYLERISKSFKCAAGIADILRHLLYKQLKPIWEKKLKDKQNAALFRVDSTSIPDPPPPPPLNGGNLEFGALPGLELELPPSSNGLHSDFGRPGLGSNEFFTPDAYGMTVMPDGSTLPGFASLPPAAFDLSASYGAGMDFLGDYQGQVEGLFDDVFPDTATTDVLPNITEIQEADYAVLQQLWNRHFAP